MKSASFIFDRRLYELLQEQGRTTFTTRELRDAYAERLGKGFSLNDVRRYVYEQIRRMLRLGWLVLDEERRTRGQVYHLKTLPARAQLELIDDGFELRLMAMREAGVWGAMEPKTNVSPTSSVQSPLPRHPTR